MTKLRALVREVHRRSLWQVVGIYAATSWVVLQVVETLTETVGLPEWFGPVAFGLLLVGLPIVVATAFVQEGMGTAGSPDAAGSSDAAGPPRGDVSPETSSAPGKGFEGATGPTRSPTDEPEPRPSSSPSPAGRHRLFTWRNAILGGVAAFLLLGLATGGYLAMRSLGIGPAGTLVAKGVLEERGRVLVAEFGSASGDTALAEAATEALRVDLTQSPVVTVVEPRAVAEALARMRRPEDTRLDRSLAAELAIREGIPAFVAGEISAAGEGYVLTADLVSSAEGEVLTSQREAARDGGEVIDAIDRLSRKLREKVGESLRSTRADPPLEQVTTGSLEALRKYSQGIRAIDVERDSPKGVALLEEAVALDSTFAIAWRKLGTELRNMQQERSRWVDAMTRAVRHRDRLTERERYLTLATYYNRVTGEREKAIRAFESMLELDPTDGYAIGNLGLIYTYELRDHERAETLLRRGLEADSSFTFHHTILVDALVNQGRFAEAEAVLDGYDRRFGEHGLGHLYRVLLEVARRDWSAALAHASAIRELGSGGAGYWRAEGARALAWLRATRGELAAAEDRLAGLESVQADRDLSAEALWARITAAEIDLEVRADPPAAVVTLEAALSERPLESLDPLERPYVTLASLYARADRPARARALLGEWEEAVPEELRRTEAPAAAEARGQLALAEGRAAEAVAEFRRAEDGECWLCPLPGLARAHEAAGRRDSARATLERYAEAPMGYRLRVDAFHLGAAYERLGELYDEAGDLEDAALWYGRFTELWEDADPELRPRVEAAQRRLEAILAERG